MVSRRTSARLELAAGVLALLFELYARRSLGRHEDAGDLPPVSPYGLVMGGVSQTTQNWLRDNDVGRMRSSRRRGVVASLCFIVWGRLVCRRVSDPKAVRRSFALGRTVGAVCYRLWYGLLRPLPGDGQ